jgi:hypothetical protein
MNQRRIDAALDYQDVIRTAKLLSERKLALKRLKNTIEAMSYDEFELYYDATPLGELL